MPYKILLVDDSAFIRRSLRRCIEANSAWTVCGEAENGQMALEQVAQHSPDVVILDLQMPAMGGLEAAGRISQLSPNTLLVMFTMHCNEVLRQDARNAGITHVFSKDEGADHLLALLRDIAA